MNSGRELLEAALTVKENEGAQEAVYYLEERGIPRDLAAIALVGIRRSRTEFGVKIDTCVRMNWRD